MKDLLLPLSEKDVKELKIGESITLTGTVVTARDEAHIRALELVEEGGTLPVDLKGSAVFHCGPIMQQVEGGWKLIAAGPTTSSRMNALEPDFIERFGVRAIIGKGGMSQPTIDAMKSLGCVYLAFTGGAAVLAAKGIRSVKDVHWLELGMPEALWILEAERFGPLTVAIDSHGNSLYQNIEKETEGKMPKIRRKLGID